MKMQFDRLPKLEDRPGYVDGAMLCRWIEGFELAAGRLPNVLVARTLAEGISIRTTLLSAMSHHPMLVADLKVRAEEQCPEGSFYLTIDESKEDL